MIAPLAPQIERYLEAQERFEALRSRTVRRAGRSLVDLAYANGHDGPTAGVREALRAALDRERVLDLQYTPYGGSTLARRLIARRLSTTHGRRFDWRDVVLAPGAMAALNLLLRLVRRDDATSEVVILTPSWLDYPLYVAQLGMTPVPVALAEGQGEDGRWDIDLDALAAALGPRTRAVVLAQPNNPLGTLHAPERLAALGALLRSLRHPPLLIADECHRDLVFDRGRFTSPLEHYAETCLVYSFGKSLLTQGQRIGYIAVSPECTAREAVARQLERLCRAMGFCAPTALMQHAVRDLLAIEPALGALRRRRTRVLGGLTDAGYDVVPSDGTFFLYARVPGDDDVAFVERLAERSVLALPSTMFHQRGFVRLSLTATDEMIARALPVFAALARGPARAEPVAGHACR